METASAEAYLKSINESLEKLSTSISKYEQNTLDHYALEELAIFKQEKDSLEKRAKSIKSQFDINHSPSPLDAESLLNKTKQLRSDINNLRSRVNARRSAESIKEIMKADSLGVIEAAKYYILCMKNPATNDEKEIEGVKQALKGIIETCKVY